MMTQLALFLLILQADPEREYDRQARQAVPRDAFPVFNAPRMVAAADAGFMNADDRVIGVAIGREAKAYPIRVMGVHELGNDTCGGRPIAVSW